MDNYDQPQRRAAKPPGGGSLTTALADAPAHWLFSQFADRWTLPVLSVLQFSAKRFTELQETLHPISHRMLSRTLQKLLRLGLVTRIVVPTTPPQVRYEISALGRSLAKPLGRLIHWSQENIDTVRSARAGRSQH